MSKYRSRPFPSILAGAPSSLNHLLEHGELLCLKSIFRVPVETFMA